MNTTHNSAHHLPLAVIVLAAGFSSRMGFPKVHARLGEYTVLERSLRAFAPFLSRKDGAAQVSSAECIVCLPATELERVSICEEIKELYSGVSLKFVAGGASRADSVSCGLEAISETLKTTEDTLVLIHDAARCMLTSNLITRVMDALEKHPAVVPAIPVTDSVVEIDKTSQAVLQYLDRTTLRCVQTPQGFLLAELLKRLSSPKHVANERTDEGSLFDQELFVVEGELSNLKITYPEDLNRAESLLV